MQTRTPDKFTEPFTGPGTIDVVGLFVSGETRENSLEEGTTRVVPERRGTLQETNA